MGNEMRAAWNLKSDRSDKLPLPPHVSFLDTLRGLRTAGPYNNQPVNDYSFCILEYGDDYIQCAVTGRDFDVECRYWSRDGSYKHYVFHHLKGPDGPPSADRLRPREHYLLTVEETAALFDAYYAGGPWPPGFGMEDITHTFK